MVRPSTFRRDFTMPLNALQGELNRLIEQYWPAWVPGSQERAGTAWVPAIDLYETADEVVVLADVPGVDPEAIDLTVDGQILSLRGEKPAGNVEEPGSGGRKERPHGAFQRQVTLPSPVDVDAVKASVQNGVLQVRLPKTESARARQIPIQPS